VGSVPSENITVSKCLV